MKKFTTSTATTAAIAALVLTGCQGPTTAEDETPAGPETAQTQPDPTQPDPTQTDQTETDPTTTPEDGDGDEASPTTADDAEPSPTDEVATEDPADDDAPEFMPADEDAEEPAAAHTGEQQDDPADTQEITDVEITAHEGFDRVELHLTGDEVELGWLASFEDEAREAGSGMPIEVEGEAVLLVGINGIDWTAESAQRYDGTTVDGDDTDVITEVVFGTLFEGQQDLYVGVSERAPYRIHAVDDPARILIDVEHP